MAAARGCVPAAVSLGQEAWERVGGCWLAGSMFLGKLDGLAGRWLLRALSRSPCWLIHPTRLALQAGEPLLPRAGG